LLNNTGGKTFPASMYGSNMLTIRVTNEQWQTICREYGANNARL
jgi:hypothetical protein